MRETSRVRMTPEDRRRQLVGIGLRKFVERPVQELSLDEVAAEAGVSRGLLFHYFPTKTDYHREVVEAARRRVVRNVSPDPDAVGDLAVRQVVERFLDQVARRRESYVALVLGQAPIAQAVGAGVAGDPGIAGGPDAGGAGVGGAGVGGAGVVGSGVVGSGVGGLREQIAGLVVRVAELPDAALPAAHGWVAYLEDRALQWSALPDNAQDAGREALVDHCTRALTLLTARPSPELGAQMVAPTAT